jgi:hypothetical protein
MKCSREVDSERSSLSPPPAHRQRLQPPVHSSYIPLSQLPSEAAFSAAVSEAQLAGRTIPRLHLSQIFSGSEIANPVAHFEIPKFSEDSEAGRKAATALFQERDDSEEGDTDAKIDVYLDRLEVESEDEEEEYDNVELDSDDCEVIVDHVSGYLLQVQGQRVLR